MRCNYLHIWLIYSCRERPNIQFKLKECNLYFNLKCNFQQSWSQQFGLNVAQACAGRAKDGWGRRTERDREGQPSPLLPQHPHWSAKQLSPCAPVCKMWHEATTARATCSPEVSCFDPSIHPSSRHIFLEQDLMKLPLEGENSEEGLLWSTPNSTQSKAAC